MVIMRNRIAANPAAFPFDAKKAAEVAAFFLLKARERDASITVLKLMKLMYLAERKSYQQYGAPIVGDDLFSMPHGPVLSNTLNLINSAPEERQGGDHWDALIAERDSGKYMCLQPDARINSTDDLLQLSDADVEILELVWYEFGNFSAHKLRDYTHDHANCPEWEDPNGSSIPISMNVMLESMGYSPDAIQVICSNLQQMASTSAILKPQVVF
ncbi:MAG: SocA family protein [Ferrovum myxofaciens]|nr:SocA family protein [Ferrovum myxofaciens]